MNSPPSIATKFVVREGFWTGGLDTNECGLGAGAVEASVNKPKRRQVGVSRTIIIPQSLSEVASQPLWQQKAPGNEGPTPREISTWTKICTKGVGVVADFDRSMIFQSGVLTAPPEVIIQPVDYSKHTQSGLLLKWMEVTAGRLRNIEISLVTPLSLQVPSTITSNNKADDLEASPQSGPIELEKLNTDRPGILLQFNDSQYIAGKLFENSTFIITKTNG
ncbi:hypothetical protein Ddc_06118 [Ditylenchus destructor]|nr:hypothetical protein Ddc_06118 [Ditylenchus destructor]